VTERVYVPQRGDIAWLTLDPTLGHEQAGRRPVVVLSKGSYNERVGLMLCCPITSRAKGYPFECPLPPEGPVTGVALADQIKSVDFEQRSAEPAHKVPDDVVEVILARSRSMLT